jgi:site-specific recombinase XerD
MDSVLEQYRQYLLDQHKEMNTMKAYLHEAEGFLGWCSIRSAGLSDLSQETLIEYREALLQRGVKVATVNKALSTLSTFFKWGLSTGLLHSNFARRLRLPEARKGDAPRWLSPEEETRLLEAVRLEFSPFQRIRNEALIYIMLYAGLRVEEIPQLQIGVMHDDSLDVYDNGVMTRTVPLNDVTIAKLQHWLQLRQASVKQLHAASPWLFVTERSGSMQARAIQFVVETYSEKLGLPLSSQTLRNTYCRRLVEQGERIERIQQLAGHKTLLTTWKYYR